MCVIAICDEVRPTEEQVGKMFESNNAGAGIAWREGGAVKWLKGLDLDEVTKLCGEVPLPFVVHFRIPSVGGKTPFLCHPFPVAKDVPLELKGTTKGYVLFHNGHWTRWRDMTLEAAVRSNTPVPSGKWSDTRAMAFNAAVYGPGILELIDEKAVLFGPNKVEVFGSWIREGEMWVSNTSWKSTSFYRGNRHQTWEGHMPVSRQLPTTTTSGGSEVDDEVAIVELAVTPPGRGRGRNRQRTDPQVPEGVDLDTTPFEQVTAMFEREEISRNQWKKQRRRWEAQQHKRKAKGKKGNKHHQTIH